MSAELRAKGLRRPRLEARLWGEWPAGADLALRPAELLYRLAVGVRGAAYERGWLRSAPAAIPALGIGNLTIGGAGKTPLSAWAARDLAAGRRVALVLRGYGADEPQVHRWINPEIPVVVDPDRLRAARTAADRGAELVVLDDVFQHRRLRPDVNVLLLPLHALTRPIALLPRGPWREPPSAARRADLLVITRRDGEPEPDAAVGRRLESIAPGVPRARILLTGGDVRAVEQGRLGASALAHLRDRPGPAPVAVAGVARPESVWAALDRLGIACTLRLPLGDHHRYTAEHARALTEVAGPAGVVVTVKDAVKLHGLLPDDVPLYALTQEVRWEAGREHWDRACERLRATAARRLEPA